MGRKKLSMFGSEAGFQSIVQGKHFIQTHVKERTRTTVTYNGG